MFKKPFKAQTQSLLKKSDARKFREQLRKVFSLSEEQLSLLFSAKDEVGTRNVQGTHTVIYFVNGVPLFFDPEGKERFVPTVYAMWRVPTLLPSLAIHAGVLKYIVGGANLMLPGVVLPEGGIPALGEFKKGDTRAIVIHGTNVPVAVGYMDLGAMALNRQGKMEGQGMQVLHFWRDQLWAMGPKEAPPTLMNAPEAVETTENAPVATQANAASIAASVSAPIAAAGAQTAPATTDDTDAMPPGKSEKSDASSSGAAKPVPAAAGVMSAPPEEIVKPITAGGAEGGSKEAMDELLRTCFLSALKRSLKDKDLPILLNLFFANHLLAVKPKDETLDMKKTSYKKISKFISEMEEQGLVKTAEPSAGVIQIVSVNRGHRMYTSCKAPKIEKKEEKEEANDSPLVAELFKPHSGLALVMGDAPERDYYRRKDLLDILWAYVAKLPSAKQSATVALDFALSEGVYQKQKKVGDVVEKKELAERFLARTAKFYSITRNGETEIHKGVVPTVSVQQRLRGGRHTTVITGLDGFGFDAKELDKLASELKSHFACAASVQEASVGTGVELMLQGHIGREVQTYLAQQIGIPQKHLELS